MQQLLQARGWYGVFFVKDPLSVSPDSDGGLVETFRVSIRLRPLIGWMSAEGGFQGLYYHEARGALYSWRKITEEVPGYFCGDICVDEVHTIQAILQHAVVEKGRAWLKDLMGRVAVDLSEEAKIFLDKGRLPIPRPIQ